MKNMGLLYDTFQSCDIHTYVITYTVAHQQYTNKYAHTQNNDKIGNRSGNLMTSNDRVKK